MSSLLVLTKYKPTAFLSSFDETKLNILYWVFTYYYKLCTCNMNITAKNNFNVIAYISGRLQI